MQKGDQDIKLERKAFIRKSVAIDESYQVTKRAMATGSYGAVHMCTHKVTKEIRIVKIVPKFKMTNVESFINEVDLLKLVVPSPEYKKL